MIVAADRGRSRLNPLPPLTKRVDRFLTGLSAPIERLIVAVSGGPDSVALLRALAALRPCPLLVAHLNHQLRGAESDEDESFVRQLCDSLGSTTGAAIECQFSRVDVRGQADRAGENLEHTARRLRYDWLIGLAHEAGTRWIATGHTADDQAETVLHHLLRGTGLHGLRGIAARREVDPGVEVIRPLLSLPRAEVMAYLAGEEQAYRTDCSNADLEFTRNRIRHELLPHLAATYNPAIASVLCRLAEQAQALAPDLEHETRQLLAAAELPRAGSLLIFDGRPLATGSRHLVRAMFRQVWLREGWPMGPMTFAHFDRLAAVALGETAATDLPGGIRARGKGHVVQLGPGP